MTRTSGMSSTRSGSEAAKDPNVPHTEWRRVMNLYTVAHNLVKMTNIIFAAQAAADGIRSALYTHEFTAKEDA